MNQKLRSCLSLVYGVFVSCPRKALEPSACPQMPRKPFVRRYLDLLYLRLRDGWLCQEYNGLRCDLQGHSCRDVVTCGMIYNRMVPHARRRSEQYVAILDDKNIFANYLATTLGPQAVVPVIASIHFGKCYIQGQLVSQEALRAFLLEEKTFFAKAPTGLCGIGIHQIKVENGEFRQGDSAWRLEDAVQSGAYFIFQKVVENHAQLKRINPSTLNTLRIVTCWKDGRVQLFDDALLRMGRRDGNVDNFFAGGLAVGIHPDGHCYPVAMNHNAKMIYHSFTEHPDSHIVFDGLEIPFFNEAIALAKRAQECFPSILSIGWDIAITPEGPCLVEGNCDWDICLLQTVVGHDLMGRFREIYAQK